MDCVLSPEPSREGQQLDGVVGQSIEFIATVRIRLRECSGAGGEGGEGGGALANGVQGGEGAGAGGGREGGSSSGEESSPAVTITVDFELYSDFTDILTEFNRILSAHGNTAIQSNSTDRKIVFDCVERGALSYFSSFIESLCVVFPRPVSVFET